MSNKQRPKCAACKHLRRRCGPSCVLAPYFPPDREEQFLNAHKLYGASFVTATIKNAPPNKRNAAAKAIIQECDVFAKDPCAWLRIATELERRIKGTEYECCRVLQQLVNLHQDELNFVRNQLSLHRRAAATAAPAHHHQHQDRNQVQDPGLMMPKFTANDQDQYMLQKEFAKIEEELMFDNKLPFVDEYQMNPILEEPDPDLGIDEFIFEAGETDEHSDREILNEGRVISEEDNAAIQHVQDHYLEGGATLFPLTSCTISEYNDPSKRS